MKHEPTRVPTVSVVIPIRNEEKYIKQCLDSLLEQDFPKERMEAILVDGMSTDKTVEIINEYIREYPFVRLIQNPKKTVQHALNYGIKAALGDYIVRFDAHSEYAEDYITKCVEYHLKVDADNIGGPNLVKGRTPCQRAIAAAYYSPFALGGGKNHIEGYEGYSDTVSFGSFLKSTAEELGLFDEELTLNEDDDFNFRLIENGGKVFITPEIKSIYYPRENYRSLARQYFKYGQWKVAVIKKHRKPARLSHLVPCCFVLFLLLGALLSLLMPWFTWGYAAILCVYLGMDLYYSFSSKYITGLIGHLRLAWVHFVLHFSYGLGFLQGIFKFMFVKFKEQTNEN